MKKLILLVAIGTAFFQVQSVSSRAACVAGDVAGPAKVADLRTNAIASTGIIYSFTAPTDASTLSEIDLRYRTVPLTALNWATATQATSKPIPGASGTTQCANLNGLSQNITYYIGVKVKDACGNWNVMSNVVNFKTPIETAPPPKKTLTFSWSPNPPVAGLAYRLYYGYKSATDPTWVRTDDRTINTGNVTAQSIIISPGSYFFRLTAYVGSDESGFSDEIAYTYTP